MLWFEFCIHRQDGASPPPPWEACPARACPTIQHSTRRPPPTTPCGTSPTPTPCKWQCHRIQQTSSARTAISPTCTRRNHRYTPFWRNGRKNRRRMAFGAWLRMAEQVDTWWNTLLISIPSGRFSMFLEDFPLEWTTTPYPSIEKSWWFSMTFYDFLWLFMIIHKIVKFSLYLSLLGGILWEMPSFLLQIFIWY